MSNCLIQKFSRAQFDRDFYLDQVALRRIRRARQAREQQDMMEAEEEEDDNEDGDEQEEFSVRGQKHVPNRPVKRE